MRFSFSLISGLFLSGALVLSGGTAQAGYQVRPQAPQSVLVAAAPDSTGGVKVELTALPVVTGCGKMSPLPANVVYDQYAVDVYVGDPAFFVPTGPGPKDCGLAMKAAFTSLSISAAALAEHDVRQIRFWYRHMLDTYPIQRSETGLSIGTPGKPKFFKPDPRKKAAAGTP